MLSSAPETAEPLYHRAAELLPYSADARNLELVARSARISDADLGKRAGTLTEAALDALAVEPANLNVLDNLEALYEFQLKKEGPSPKALMEKLAAVRKVRAAIVKASPP
jgi:hypothetical protein